MEELDELENEFFQARLDEKEDLESEAGENCFNCEHPYEFHHTTQYGPKECLDKDCECTQYE